MKKLFTVIFILLTILEARQNPFEPTDTFKEELKRLLSTDEDYPYEFQAKDSRNDKILEEENKTKANMNEDMAKKEVPMPMPTNSSNSQLIAKDAKAIDVKMPVQTKSMQELDEEVLSTKTHRSMQAVATKPQIAKPVIQKEMPKKAEMKKSEPKKVIAKKPEVKKETPKIVKKIEEKPEPKKTIAKNPEIKKEIPKEIVIPNDEEIVFVKKRTDVKPTSKEINDLKNEKIVLSPTKTERYQILPFIEASTDSNTLTISSVRYKPFKNFALEDKNKIIIDYRADTSFYTKRVDINSPHFKKVTVGNHKDKQYFRVVVLLNDRPSKYRISQNNISVMITKK